MATEAVPQSVSAPVLPDAVLPTPALPIDAVVADASAAALPIEPLAPVVLTPLPEVGRLVRIAQATLALLAHPYPHRRPRTRHEQLAFAEQERARLDRERDAYRVLALRGPFG